MSKNYPFIVLNLRFGGFHEVGFTGITTAELPIFIIIICILKLGKLIFYQYA